MKTYGMNASNAMYKTAAQVDKEWLEMAIDRPGDDYYCADIGGGRGEWVQKPAEKIPPKFSDKLTTSENIALVNHLEKVGVITAERKTELI